MHMCILIYFQLHPKAIINHCSSLSGIHILLSTTKGFKYPYLNLYPKVSSLTSCTHTGYGRNDRGNGAAGKTVQPSNLRMNRVQESKTPAA